MKSQKSELGGKKLGLHPSSFILHPSSSPDAAGVTRSASSPEPPSALRKPDWLKTRLPSGTVSRDIDRLLARLKLNTVCASARCPNLGACWGRGTATFMILGDVCTRHCKFCAVKTGNPGGIIDADEPGRIVQAVSQMNLRYVVLTSVDRDDLPDFGAGHFAATVRVIKETVNRSPLAAHSSPQESDGLTQKRSAVGGRQLAVEVLVPDFAARPDLIGTVLAAEPDVFAHNLETVEALASSVRDRRADYRRSLNVLRLAKEIRPGQITKCGIMVGLGETGEQVLRTLQDMRSVGTDILTIGQYLQPTRRNLPVAEYVSPVRFAEYESQARGIGFRAVLAGPLVRSSYHADEALRGATTKPNDE